MKTQVSILVKNASLWSRATGSFLWFIDIFKKMPVNVVIDDPNAAPQVLTARKEPYIIDLAPGHHTLVFTDPKARGKARNKAITAGMMGGILGLAGGGSVIGSAADMYDAWNDTTVREGVLQVDLQEGDVLCVSAKPKSNGMVKVKILK